MAVQYDDVPPISADPDEPLLGREASTSECSEIEGLNRGEITDAGHTEDEQQSSGATCYGRICFHKQRTKKDIILLCLHIFNFLIVGALCALIVYHKKAGEGLCLTAAAFLEGGIVQYNTSVVWCNLLLYACIVSASMSWVSIVVKWTAQAYGAVRWLKTDFVGSTLVLCVILGVLVAQSIRFGEWCSDMNHSLSPHAEYNQNITTHIRCQKNAQQIDYIYPEIVKLNVAFQFTVGELVLSSIHLIMWCIIVNFSFKRMKYQIKIKREYEIRIQRESLLNDEVGQFLQQRRAQSNNRNRPTQQSAGPSQMGISNN